MTSFRSDVAACLQSSARVPRVEVFGAADATYLPNNNVEDANTVFAGYVGPDYRQGGAVLFGVNPGGGGDGPTHRSDSALYRELRRFRDAATHERLQSFEAVNDAFQPILKSWNLWRIVQPILNAFGITLEQVCYLNVVPYRTRGNKKPPANACRAAWSQNTGPTLAVLEPGVWVALGKKAADIISSATTPPPNYYVVPRTIGDSYISGEAAVVLEAIRSARRT